MMGRVFVFDIRSVTWWATAATATEREKGWEVAADEDHEPPLGFLVDGASYVLHGVRPSGARYESPVLVYLEQASEPPNRYTFITPRAEDRRCERDSNGSGSKDRSSGAEKGSMEPRLPRLLMP